MMLEVRTLEYRIKNGKRSFAIQNVSFELQEGYLMCLLGRNGAGKSTLLRLLYGMLLADAGEILYEGKEISKNRNIVRQEIGYLGDEPIFFERQTLRENVQVLSGLYPAYSEKDFISYLGKFEMDMAVLDKTLSELSTGQRKQVQLAFVLARHPRLILLDEPMANLDVVFRMEFMEVLQELIAEEQVSVILSTHLLDDVRDTADYVGVLEDGKMTAFGDRERVMLDGSFEKMGKKE